MNYIAQQDRFGCCVAVLAMLTDREYTAVAACFQTNFSIEGIDAFEMTVWLAEQGYATAVKYPYYAPARAARETWPAPPFAPRHFVFTTSKGKYSHCVAMDALGGIYDPADRTRRRIEDYGKTYLIGGVVPIKAVL